MLSLQRQREIYLNGLAGYFPKTSLSFAGLEHKARQILPAHAFAYLAGGAGRETTIDHNRQALDQIKIHPHMLGGVQEVSMQLKWREHTLPAPFMLAPIGVLELAHREGDKAVAQAAKTTGVPMIISSQASFPMEEIASKLESNPRLFQLYYSKSKELSQSFIRRAEAIGCTALVVTLDTTMLGWRVRDLDLGYSPFLAGRGIAQYYSDPVFNQLPDPVDNNTFKPPLSLSLIKSLISLNSRMPGGFISNLTSKKAMKSVRKFTSVFNNPGMNWDDIALIRSWTKMPVYLKGIIRSDDAMKAVDAGVDGIIISNHGGRQIDGSVSTAEVLPGIVDVVNDKLEVWMDSGIRTGSDVFKCIALGAKGVMIGRPYAFALACGGTKGVIDCISNIMAELELIMALSGCKTLSEINADLISHPWPVK
ncbi:MAG TPA: alpha-hydroxy-acid oxidizing protein [Saprospiraceae bacterium]|nr:alpha-hydroxy-acid oxidizing protein [Saprospiraceae bacterium]